MRVQIQVPDQKIADVLCCGMEGGIAYWSVIEGYREPKTMEFQMDTEKVFKHIDYALNLGGAVMLKDTETEIVHELTRDKLYKAVQMMADRYPRHFANLMDDNSDAETGDVLIQCAVLGSITYG